MFKFVPYETRTVGKRAAGILLECFLVVFIFPVDCAGWGDGWNETKLQLRQQREGGENQHGGDVQGCVWGGTGESYSEAGLALRLGSSLRKPTRLCIWWNRWVMWWSRSSTMKALSIITEGMSCVWYWIRESCSEAGLALGLGSLRECVKLCKVA